MGSRWCAVAISYFNLKVVKFSDIRHVVQQVIAATNRADILDPALMRSGRLDRKIEFPHPTEEARARILQVCTACGEYLANLLHMFGYCFFWLLLNLDGSDVADPFKKDECPH